MPIYEYACLDCGASFETVAKYDEEKPCCPLCRSMQTRKMLSAVTYRYADNWQQQHLGALHRSLERDEIKKEAQKQVDGAVC